MTRLYTYRETYDTGFAPNPFHGVLTLANCKPAIRRTAEVGDWVAAFTAKNVRNGKQEVIYRGKSGEEKVVWIGRVTKKLTYAEYWEQYKQKRPKSLKGTIVEAKGGGCGAKEVVMSNGCGAKDVATSAGCGAKSTDTIMPDDFGDNIYMPDEKAPLGFIQIPNRFHEEWNMKTDLSGKFVLICEEFYYFGAASSYAPLNRPVIPTGVGHRVNNADDEAARKFIEEFKQFTIGIQKRGL